MTPHNRSLWFTGVLLAWLMLDISWATHHIFSHMTLINSAVTAAYAALLGLPATIVGLYEWVRRKKS